MRILWFTGGEGVGWKGWYLLERIRKKILDYKSTRCTVLAEENLSLAVPSFV